MAKKVRIGDLLVSSGIITKEQLAAALAMQARSGGRVGSNLVELGIVDERALAHVLAQQLNIPSASAAQLDKPAKAALERITRALAERHRAVPLRIDGQRLWIALADPTDSVALSALQRESGMEVRPMVAPDMLIDYALNKHYGVKRSSRVLEVRDAQLLEVEPADELPTYDPHAIATPSRPTGVADDSVAAPPGLGFLDERSQVAPAPLVPRENLMETLRAQLMAASSDEAVFAAALDALRPAAARMALLLVRGGVLAAHRGHGLDQRSIALIRLQLTESSELTRILRAGVPSFGALPSELGALFQPQGSTSGLVLPITMGKKPIGAMVFGQIVAELPSRSVELGRITEMIDLALHVGHLRARLARV